VLIEESSEGFGVTVEGTRGEVVERGFFFFFFFFFFEDEIGDVNWSPEDVGA